MQASREETNKRVVGLDLRLGGQRSFAALQADPIGVDRLFLCPILTSLTSVRILTISEKRSSSALAKPLGAPVLKSLGSGHENLDLTVRSRYEPINAPDAAEVTSPAPKFRSTSRWHTIFGSRREASGDRLSTV